MEIEFGVTFYLQSNSPPSVVHLGILLKIVSNNPLEKETGFFYSYPIL